MARVKSRSEGRRRRKQTSVCVWCIEIEIRSATSKPNAQPSNQPASQTNRETEQERQQGEKCKGEMNDPKSCEEVEGWLFLLPAGWETWDP